MVRNHSSFKSILDTMWKTRDLITYVGKIRVTDYVITNLQIRNGADNKKGFKFTATLQKANIVSGQYVEMGQTTLMSQQDASGTSGVSEASGASAQTAEVKSAGLQTTVSQQISQSAYAAYVNSYNGKKQLGAK